MEQTGRIVKIVSVDLKADRATVLNVAIHTIAIDKIKAPVAVVQGKLCPRVWNRCRRYPIFGVPTTDAGGRPEGDCAWCSALRERIEASRKE